MNIVKTNPLYGANFSQRYIDYVTADGELALGAQTRSVMVRSEDDLENLPTEVYEPGSTAYLADGSAQWRLGVDGEWYEYEDSEASGGGASSASSNIDGVGQVGSMVVGGESANTPSMLVANMSYDENTGGTILDKTWKEIHDAFVVGVPCFVLYENDENGYSEFSQIIDVGGVDQYFIFTFSEGENMVLITDSKNGFPHSSIEDS